MKVTSAILTTMSGKLGGAVAATARGGIKYFRSKVNPSNPRTFNQSTVRAILTTLAATYTGTLNDTERAGWSAIAPTTGSGIDAFVKGNAQPQLAAQPVVTTAPTSAAMVYDPIPSIVTDASAHSITLPGPVPTDKNVNVFATRQQHPSRGARQNSFQFVGTMAEGDSTIAIPAGHPAYALTAGQVVYVKFVPFGNTGGSFAGQVATPQIFRSVVVA